MGRFRFAAVAVSVLAMVAAGCGGDGADGDASPTGADAPPTETAADDPAGGGVTMADLSFSPDPIQATQGDELALRNDDGVPHTFTVTDTDIDVEVAAGASGAATVDLEPGTYDVICRFHEASGMTATLEVG